MANALTTAIPQAKMLSSLVGMAAKTFVFVGEASVEVDIRDSITHRRLAAAVDRRIGTKTYSGMFSDWSDVEEALDYWAERIARRIAAQKGIEFPEEE